MLKALLLIYIFELAVTAAGLVILWDRPNAAQTFMFGLAAGAAALAVPLAFMRAPFPGVSVRDTEVSDSFFDEMKPVDPWELERPALDAAGKLPHCPMVTRSVLEGYAQILATVASLGNGLLKAAIRHQIKGSDGIGFHYTQVEQTIDRLCVLAGFAAQQIRESGEWPEYQLDLDLAVLQLEDSAILVGAAAALSLQMGLPGDEGYKMLRGITKPDFEKLLVDHYPFLLSELPEQPIINLQKH